MFDKVIFVSVDKDLQLKRLIARNHYSEEEALKRISSQMSQEEKIKKADYVILNNTSVEDLNKQVERLLETL
jgi:dephospho-CoA kinase